MPAPRDMMYPGVRPGDPLTAGLLQDIASLASRSHTGHVTSGMNSESSGIATSQDPPAGFWARVNDSTIVPYLGPLDMVPHLVYRHAFTELTEDFDGLYENLGDAARFKDKEGGVKTTMRFDNPGLFEANNRRIMDGTVVWCVRGNGEYYVTHCPPLVVPLRVTSPTLVPGTGLPSVGYGSVLYYPAKTLLWTCGGQPDTTSFPVLYTNTDLGPTESATEGLVDCFVTALDAQPLEADHNYLGLFAGYDEDYSQYPAHVTKTPVFHVVDNRLPLSGVTPGTYLAASLTVSDTGLITSASSGTHLGVPYSATTLGTVTGAVEVFDAAGASQGFLPIYDTIS